MLFHHLRSPVQCGLPQPVVHSSIDGSGASVPQELANEGDERVLRCDAGYVIDGFQPFDVALMTCKNAGGAGEWQCSAGIDNSDMEESDWPCAARACVEVSYCDPLPDTVDTGCVFLPTGTTAPSDICLRAHRPVHSDLWWFTLEKYAGMARW